MTTLLVLALAAQAPEYPVRQVLSGEVIVIQWGRQAINVRLHDVQAPHVEARDRLRDLLDGETVFLIYPSSGPFDHAGRLSAYVYRTSDKAMVNEDLIRNGYAGLAGKIERSAARSSILGD
jgi:endonuclease YncB( thermonuclease family)